MTTDEMDHTTPEERNKLVGICVNCNKAVPFTRGVDPEKCDDCGSNFAIGSVISQRTFNPANHKKRKGQHANKTR